MMRFVPFIAPLPLLGAVLYGCADTAECSEGQKLENGYCIDDVAAGSGGAGGGGGSKGGTPAAGGVDPGDAGTTDAAAGGDAAPGDCQGNAVEFAAPCTDDVDHSECGCPANYCAISPLMPDDGYCTVTGCKEDPSVCPDGWGCLDVSIFQPGQPSVCTKPM
jgi:hypothetical protein